MMRRASATALTTIAAMIATPAAASGPSGAVLLTSVAVEGQKIYLTSKSFGNPDGCASAAVVVLAAQSEQEYDRMLSIALTAYTSKSKVSLWLSGCAPAPWYPTIPQGVSIAILDE